MPGLAHDSDHEDPVWAADLWPEISDFLAGKDDG
ncbi:hypothetical protein H4W33_000565 [Kibdelosporangium phytohabitans]|nr:hypothetical protein [Kibdelosporangium phytohabitans]